MAIVLGIDAAWTAGHPSGVALVDTSRAERKCVIAAPSYESFLSVAGGGAVQWGQAQKGGTAPVAELLAAAQVVTGAPVDVVAIDMPISTRPITSRRAADVAVSREFGSRWCAAHSPNAMRPGQIGAHLTRDFGALGFSVATAETAPGTGRRLVEVYPHPALLALLGSEKRVPYKVANARKYWPDFSPTERIARLLDELRAIESALSEVLGPLPFRLADLSCPTPTLLKRYEDTVDAVISAWVGWLYVEGSAVPLGDATGAIWCPSSVVMGAAG